MSRRLLTLAAVAAAAGCAADPPAACPAVYAPRGVLFHFDPVTIRSGAAGSGVRIRACMEGACTTTDSSASASVPFVSAGAERADSPRAVTARFTVTDVHTGTVRIDASTVVTLSRITAPSCVLEGQDQSDGYQASVWMTADGTLRPA